MKGERIKENEFLSSSDVHYQFTNNRYSENNQENQQLVP